MDSHTDTVDLRAAEKRLKLLRSIAARLRAGHFVSPAELTARMPTGRARCDNLFAVTACTAVLHKYSEPLHPQVAAHVDACRDEWLRQPYTPATVGSHSTTLPRLSLALRNLHPGFKSIGVRATRRRAHDPDLLLCEKLPFGPRIALTPWVCQQPDLRYAWNDHSLTKLDYLGDWWDAYLAGARTIDAAVNMARRFPMAAQRLAGLV